MRWITLILFVWTAALNGELQTLAQKRESVGGRSSDLDGDLSRQLESVNTDLMSLRQQLHSLYDEVQALQLDGADEEQFRALVNEIRGVKSLMRDIEEQWRKDSAKASDSEPYALWHQPDTSLEELVMEYGAQDYVYLIPPEVSDIRVSINSNLAIPRASWEELLDTILAEHGVTVRQLNPYLRQLQLSDQASTEMSHILNDRKLLDTIPSRDRVAFLLNSPVSDVRRVYHFLERFAPKSSATIQLLGRTILISASRAQVQELLKLHDFTSTGYAGRDWRFVALSRIDAEEMAEILGTVFASSPAGKEEAVAVPAQGLKIVPLTHLGQALFLLGTQSELEKAEEVIRDVQSQLGEVRDKVVHWYTVKHSDPEELADVLSRVYNLMIAEQIEPEGDVDAAKEAKEQLASRQAASQPEVSTYSDAVPFYAGGNPIVDPGRSVNPLKQGRTRQTANRDNFIVDEKTGSIVMVVESAYLGRIKDLTRRLDVAKKMIQIDVLLFEKRVTDNYNHGLNLLRIGDSADNVEYTGLSYGGGSRGILDFVMKRVAGDHGLAAYDIAYNFLLTQDDIEINASPSVTTVNQTPATISIVDEISINTGTVEVETAGTTQFKDQFARAQYGITLKITPTVHTSEDGWSEDNYITLDTDVTFDTVQRGGDPNRPDVTRRNITNLVDVADGETLILGGLRRLTTTDSKASVPFLGEVPGIGKLFSNKEMEDISSEMFIFITPHIVENNREALERSRCRQLCRRPGDHPEFMQCLLEAQEYGKRRTYEGGLRMILGREEVPNLGVCR